MTNAEKLGPWGRWSFVRDEAGPFLQHRSRVNPPRIDYDVSLNGGMSAADWLQQIRAKNWPTSDKHDFARALSDVLAAKFADITIEDDRAARQAPMPPASPMDNETAVRGLRAAREYLEALRLRATPHKPR